MKMPELPEDSRPLAVGLLVVVLVLVYFLGIHWWFVAPQLAVGAQMDDLREQQQRYAAIVAEKPAIEERLAQVREYEKTNQAFLSQTDPAAASALLIQRVNQAIKQHDPEGGRCSSQQSTALSNRNQEERYLGVSVRIRMQCDLGTTARVLYDLEEGKPFLFIDELMIYQRARFHPGQPASSMLQVQFTITGYLRQRGDQADDEGKA